MFLAAGTVLGLLLTACGSIQSEVVQESSGAPLATAARKPAVQLQIQPGSHAAIIDVATSTTNESGLFGDLTLNGSSPQPVDFVIKLNFEARRPPIGDLETVWATTTLMLFTLYPSICAYDEYNLVADVMDLHGRRLKTYDLHESDTSWMWLFQADNCASAPKPERVAQAAKSLMNKFFAELDRDRILNSTSLARVPETTQPLVYVKSNRAHDIVERVTKASAPVINMTFEETEAGKAEFSIRFNLSTSISSFRSAYALLAIPSFGLISPCDPTIFTLKTTISDRVGREVWTDERSNSYRTSTDGMAGCQSLDEQTRPEAVTDLVNAVYDKLRRDRILVQKR